MGLGAFLGLDIGKAGVMAHQRAINVVSHNITNAETEGYSRQTVSLKAKAPMDQRGAAGQLGSGVEVDEIRRIRDNLIDTQLRDQNSFSGYVEKLSESLGRLQTILNEPGENNVRGALDQFFQSLEDLNNQPDNTGVRITLIERAKSLATLVNVTSKRIEDERVNINNEISTNVDLVNSLAHSIGDINLEIKKVRHTGQNPNDLLDARDLMLDQLAELVNIDISEDSDQNMFIRLGHHLLVQSDTVNELRYVVDPRRNGLRSIATQDGIPQSSSNPSVATGYIGGDAENQNLALTVFQTAREHSTQSKALIDIKTDFNFTSSMEKAGITSGSFFLNGVQIYFDNNDNLTQLKDKINSAGLGVNAFFERGKLILNSVRTGTAHQVVFSEGTSNILDVMQFSDAQEFDVDGQLIFDGEVRDARYAVGLQTFTSSSNLIEDIVSGIDVELKSVGSTNIMANHFITSGRLRGFMEYQDKFVHDESRNIDKLGYALINEINKIHFEGFGLDGASQRLFFETFTSPDQLLVEKGAGQALRVREEIQSNVKAVAAASGVFEKQGDRIPVSSGDRDGRNALKMAQLKFAQVVDNAEFGLSTRLSVLNGGEGVDVGRPQSFFSISNGVENAVVNLEGFDENSTIQDLQIAMNKALDLNGFDTKITISTQADGTMRLVSSNINLTFLEGSGTTASDLLLTASAGAFGNGSRIVESSRLNAKFKGEPKSVIQHIQSVIAKVGVRAEEMIKLKENSETVKFQLENERLSVIGVSVDEELTNLIQYQQGFQASARIISTVNTMLDVIVNLGR